METFLVNMFKLCIPMFEMVCFLLCPKYLQIFIVWTPQETDFFIPKSLFIKFFTYLLENNTKKIAMIIICHKLNAV